MELVVEVEMVVVDHWWWVWRLSLTTRQSEISPNGAKAFLEMRVSGWSTWSPT